MQPALQFVQESFHSQAIPSNNRTILPSEVTQKPRRFWTFSTKSRSKKKLDTFTFTHLKPYFRKTISQAATELGVSESTLKKRCRDLGMLRWPSRKIQRVDHRIAILRQKLLWTTGKKSQEIQQKIQFFEQMLENMLCDPLNIEKYERELLPKLKDNSSPPVSSTNFDLQQPQIDKQIVEYSTNNESKSNYDYYKLLEDPLVIQRRVITRSIAKRKDDKVDAVIGLVVLQGGTVDELVNENSELITYIHQQIKDLDL